MAKVVISESGMQFGEYNSSNIFQIETSEQYVSKLKPSGIKISEFVLLRDKNLFILEAKTSCPNYNSYHDSTEKEAKYNEYINSICCKFRNSLNLYINIILNRYEQKELSSKLKNVDYSDIDFIFILVVKNAELTWLSHYQDVLKRELNEEMKIWKIKNLLVINEAIAREKKFII